MFRLAFAALAAAGLFAGSAAAQVQPTGDVTFPQAYQIAQDEFAGGQLLLARVETKPTATVFGYYFLYEGRIGEVEISRTGKVVKKKHGSDPEELKEISPDVLALLAKSAKEKAKLPDGRLLELAAEGLKNTPFKGMKYEIREGKLVMKVGELVIDAQTGKPVGK